MASEAEARGSSLVKAYVDTAADGAPDLRQRSRIHESVIQVFLLLSGILSIFTTIGIVIVLGRESIALFTRLQWQESNKTLVTEATADQTTLEFSTSGASLDGVEILRLREEILAINAYYPNYIDLLVTGTGGGFSAFCDTMTADIANASRPISADELATCTANGRTPLEFRVGTDALAIVVNSENDFVDDLSFDELRAIFGGAETWADVRPEWPAEPIVRSIPGTDSGTFDYFVESVFSDDADALLASEPMTSESDTQIVAAIQRDPNAIGFFGYAYYGQNEGNLRLINIEGVTPTLETAESGEYPLARPLFIYSDAQTMQDKPQVAAFINYYLTHVDEVIEEVGYFHASPEAMNRARQQWLDATGQTGETGDDGLVSLPEVNPHDVQNRVVTAGSSTVAPITERIAEDFEAAGFVPRVDVERGHMNTEARDYQAGAEVEFALSVTLFEFFTSTEWSPQSGSFGVLPLVNATIMTSLIAMLVALPLGLGAAIYLSEYAAPAIRNTLKPVLEILAGIPTVVYGYFALTFMTPLLRSIFGIETVNIYNVASAGIVVGILIIPLVSSMSEDALSAVPRALREASYGLGATKLETTIKVVIPAALSGILAAFIVSISRAIGETMVVAIAAGAGPNFTFNPFDSAETMTGHIARISGGDLSYDTIDYNSLFAIGLTLFVITLVLNVISRTIVSRFRESY